MEEEEEVEEGDKKEGDFGKSGYSDWNGGRASETRCFLGI